MNKLGRCKFDIDVMEARRNLSMMYVCMHVRRRKHAAVFLPLLLFLTFFPFPLEPSSPPQVEPSRGSKKVDSSKEFRYVVPSPWWRVDRLFAFSSFFFFFLGACTTFFCKFHQIRTSRRLKLENKMQCVTVGDIIFRIRR